MAAYRSSIPEFGPHLGRAQRWVSQNLFSGPWNTLLTLVTVLALSFVLYQALKFVFVTGDWEVVEVNRRLLFLGRFPAGQEWRLWPPIFLVSVLAGLTAGLWSRVGRQFAVILALPIALILIFLVAGNVRFLTVAAVATAALSYLTAQRWLLAGRYDRHARRITVAGWVLTFPFAIVLLIAFGGVDPSLWGGFHLNVLLAVAGITASFPLGVLLALGRASSYSSIRLASTAYIELIRGVPLISILLMAWLVLPDFLPGFAGLDDWELVYRMMTAFTLFAAAYVAEAVRGGLQAVPRGQVEAAQALGLGTARIQALIVLPQAIRAVIPALVGQYISLFKDTSLVFIVPLTDILSAGKAASEQPGFFGTQKEVLLFVALVFWTVTFSMSRLSQRLERRLGVGER